MDLMIRIYLERAENEILASKSLKRLSEDEEAKEEFGIPPDTTFYSSVISHAYYAIFYSAKAALLTKKIETKSPEIHRKTFEEFKKQFVESGILDTELLMIYKKMIIRADELLQIFKNEKWKRGHFTYETIPQANKKPAEESVEHATKFVKNIRRVLES